MRSSLFGENVEVSSSDLFSLQNSKMLRVELNGEVVARQGAMVAYQGQIDFEYQGSGGIGRFIKKALTGEGLPLMRCRGTGDLFLAHDADDVHMIRLEGDGLTVNGANILAFDPGISWDIRRVDGAGMMSGGMFNTVLTGTGWVAITTHGTPVVLQTDQPTFADAQAVVAWSSNLQTRLHTAFKMGSLLGRTSGESLQMSFAGQGFVIVQASEGPTIPPHTHGDS